MAYTYKVIRFHFNKPNRVIKTGLTLEEAQQHCQSDKTSHVSDDVPLDKQWFDGYERETS